jgi:TfoX/Sxy family transcriptional regulator of competence genes
MNTNETGAERVRALLVNDMRIEERPMFGGRGFLLGGNMVCGFTRKGEMIVRLGDAGEARARGLPGAQGMDFSRRMGGMLFVSEHAIADDDELRQWVTLAVDYVATLPAK